MTKAKEKTAVKEEAPSPGEVDISFTEKAIIAEILEEKTPEIEEPLENEAEDDNSSPETKQELSETPEITDEAKDEELSPTKKLDTQPEISEQEKTARELGWLPKEEFKGISDNWRGANEFLERKSLADTIHRQKKDLKLLTKKMDELLTSNNQRSVSELEEKNNHILELKRDAIKNGRVEDAEKLEEIYHSNKKELDTTKKPPVNLPPAVLDFKERNQEWFNHATLENRTMAFLAGEKEKELTAAYPELDYETVLTKVEELIKSTYPHRFQAPPIPKQTVVSSVDAISKKKNGKTMTFNQLSPRIKAVVNSMCRNSGSLTRDQYAQQLYDLGRL